MEFHRSAFKHGITSASIIHAMEHALVVVDLDPDADPPTVLAIGPGLDGSLMEVIWLDLADEATMVIHAMPLRTIFHDLLPPGGRT